MEFLSFLPQLPIGDYVGRWGYLAVFVIIALESSGLPLPGELTLVTAAILAATTGQLDIRLVVGAAALGAVLGDNVGYWIGREFGFRLLLAHGAKVGITERQLKLGQYLFLHHGGKVVFLGRMVAVLRVLAALLAGINRMRWPHFLVCNVAGGVLWAGLYGFGAYLLGHKMATLTGPASLGLLAAALAAALLGLRYLRHHQNRLEEQAEREFPGPLTAKGEVERR